jgi:hypothetical protein
VRREARAATDCQTTLSWDMMTKGKSVLG